MSVPFLTNDASGIETPWLDLESLLDAIEAGRVDADDYLFDRARQAWQPVRTHRGVVAAWEQRMGFRPPEARRVLGSTRRAAEGFPALSPEGITPVSSPVVSRIEAQRTARAAPGSATTFYRAMGIAEAVVVMLLMALLAVGLVWVVRGIMGMSG